MWCFDSRHLHHMASIGLHAGNPVAGENGQVGYTPENPESCHDRSNSDAGTPVSIPTPFFYRHSGFASLIT
jgi:hypothetical protein